MSSSAKTCRSPLSVTVSNVSLKSARRSASPWMKRTDSPRWFAFVFARAIANCYRGRVQPRDLDSAGRKTERVLSRAAAEVEHSAADQPLVEQPRELRLGAVDVPRRPGLVGLIKAR
jgi:hypothetical protein